LEVAYLVFQMAWLIAAVWQAARRWLVGQLSFSLLRRVGSAGCRKGAGDGGRTGWGGGGEGEGVEGCGGGGAGLDG